MPGVRPRVARPAPAGFPARSDIFVRERLGAVESLVHERYPSHWGRVILHLLIDGTNELVHQELAEVLGSGGYPRLQTDLGDASEVLDDASDENIDHLKALAATMISDRDRELDGLCAVLPR